MLQMLFCVIVAMAAITVACLGCHDYARYNELGYTNHPVVTKVVTNWPETLPSDKPGFEWQKVRYGNGSTGTAYVLICTNPAGNQTTGNWFTVKMVE